MNIEQQAEEYAKSVLNKSNDTYEKYLKEAYIAGFTECMIYFNLTEKDLREDEI